LKPLFKNKKILFVLSKTDLKRLEDIEPEDKDRLEVLLK
jgi:hypothetical protein